MTAATDRASAEAVIGRVRALDRCWLDKRFDELGDFFDADIVIVEPDGKHFARGAEAAIDSYRDFLAAVQIDHFNATDHRAVVTGDTAVVEYRFQIAWRSQDVVSTDNGREILVLNRRDDEWRVIWRMQLPGRDHAVG